MPNNHSIAGKIARRHKGVDIPYKGADEQNCYPAVGTVCARDVGEGAERKTGEKIKKPTVGAVGGVKERFE